MRPSRPSGSRTKTPNSATFATMPSTTSPGWCFVALFQDLGRVLHAAAPGHVGDVDQTVDSLFDLHERSEVGQVAHHALDAVSDVVLLRELLPGIRLGGAERQRHPPRLEVHVLSLIHISEPRD